jgi:glycosyltransferase involved in cell wall biosynthesis
VNGGSPSYAVVTPARNEADNLPRLAESIVSQTVRPHTWIIVENGSDDGTDEVARDLAEQHDFIQVLVTAGSAAPVRGAPIVRAFHGAVELLQANPPDVVVNVDADIAFDSTYFEQLLARFEDDPKLGIASGSCFEQTAGEWTQRHVTGTTVWGATRAYRWQCLCEILPLEERLGWDGIDEFRANARGWRTQTFTDLAFRHYRREGERDGAVTAAAVAQGRAAHYMGYRPWYLILRALHQATRHPAAVAMIAGYVTAAIRREPTSPDSEGRAYLRRQQRLTALPRRMLEAFGHSRG